MRGGLFEFVEIGVICKRLRKCESLNIEVIWSELAISNKNWIILRIYRPPGYSNLLPSFNELGKCLNQT